MVADRRKTFVAREELLNGISTIAKENGRSLYETVNEIFVMAMKASELGVDLKGSLAEYGKLKSAKEKGYMLCLENLWFEMSELVYANAREAALNAWRVAGVWLGKQYTTTNIEDPFKALSEDLSNFTWNVPELKLVRNMDEVSIRIRNPRFSEAYTQLFGAFLEGVISVMGYEIKEREASIGNVCLRAVRK